MKALLGWLDTVSAVTTASDALWPRNTRACGRQEQKHKFPAQNLGVLCAFADSRSVWASENCGDVVATCSSRLARLADELGEALSVRLSA